MACSKRLIHIISSNRWRGVERYALDICAEFASRGWSVTAYTREAKAVDEYFEREGIDLRHAPMQSMLDITSLRLIAKHFKREKEGAIVHCHRYRDAAMILLAKKLAKRPDIKVITTRHHVGRARHGLLLRMAYAALDAQLFVSHAARNRFLSSWPSGRYPFDLKSTRVMHNSIRHDFGEPAPEPEAGPRIAMYHGRLAPGKGLETLIDAMPMLRGMRTRLWIVGSGNPDYADRLRRRALQRGVMEMIDWKRHISDPHQLIRECHFGVLPSVSPEAFGLSNIEFMANGRPLVCSNNGAQPEYLTDGQEALLVNPGSAGDLADAMKRLATDTEYRVAMGRCAKARFDRDLSWENFADTMQKIYTTL